MSHEDSLKGNRRSPTMVKLGEIAERLRKVLKLREQINTGHYEVKNDKVAEAFISKTAK